MNHWYGREEVRPDNTQILIFRENQKRFSHLESTETHPINHQYQALYLDWLEQIFIILKRSNERHDTWENIHPGMTDYDKHSTAVLIHFSPQKNLIPTQKIKLHLKRLNLQYSWQKNEKLSLEYVLNVVQVEQTIHTHNYFSYLTFIHKQRDYKSITSLLRQLMPTSTV